MPGHAHASSTISRNSSCTREVVGQLGVERREQEPAVANEHRLAVELAEHLDAGSELPDPRRADEDAVQRRPVAGELDVRLEAPDLATVGVSVDLEVGEAEMLSVEHDHSGAGAEDRARIRHESRRRGRRGAPGA